MSKAQRPRGRQKRGLQRIEAILDAAASVFAERGVQAATTNAIADRAGVSPGSLYQFFGNKEEIADALAARYLEEFQATFDAALRDDLAGMPMENIIDRMIDPPVAFMLQHPAFEALFIDLETPSERTESAARVHQSILDRIAAILREIAPEMTASQQQLSAEVSVQIFKAIMPLIVERSGAERDSAIVELKRVLKSYFTSLGAFPGLPPS
ncbi:MAG: TetR/AcrR family transcriptional regulator [Sphaerobacteraceae bacterium]|nr:MAG: TetR/AcrR family transcriptional regulator [Sphaerobacteraceae bacterium]